MAYVVSDGENNLKVDATKLETPAFDEAYDMVINGEKKTVSVCRVSSEQLSILVDGQSYNVGIERLNGVYEVITRGETYNFTVVDEREMAVAGPEQKSGEKTIAAPMPGLVVDVLVREGDLIEKGQTILVLEAMKMQNEIKAPAAGTILKVSGTRGDSVNAGDALAVIMI